MQAIITHFIPCTNFRESRVKAVCEAGSLTLGWNHELNTDENHHACAVALQTKLGWANDFYGRLVSAGMPKGAQCHVMVPDVASAVMEWARTPGDHGGNPHCKPMVRVAERFQAVYGEK